MTNDRSRPGILRARRSGGVPSRRHQRGVALLIAILLVAFGTIIAATMAYDNAMTARRAAATFEFDQAVLVAEGAEALAAYGLQQTFKEHLTYTAPGQPWSQPLPPTEVTPGVTLEASLEDLQGRFNINNLVQTDGNTPNTAAIAAFQRLLTMVGDDPKYAGYLVDWIDKNANPTDPDGAEDSVYMEMDPPYRTPNLPITSTSELLALPGFTRAQFDRLAPYIVALPLGILINTCSASPYVLDALIGHEQFSSNPQEFQQDRTAAGGCFPTQAEVLQAAGDVQTGSVAGAATGQGGNVQQSISGLLGQTSAWFRLTSYVTLGTAEFSIYTLIYWDQNGLARPELRSFTPD
ncbi:MAG TPA: type II secretion system minor pseudopilin GspK [Steroidobacteraceae bacterium]|jgi:general secretion pathway protein K|nr:type II secretion system minor pseudopilin GspK [Steroidobacteraceae bacterium]